MHYSNCGCKNWDGSNVIVAKTHHLCTKYCLLWFWGQICSRYDLMRFTKASLDLSTPSLLTCNPFFIRRQMARDTCIPWCNEAFVFTYNHPYLYSIYIAVKSETYSKPSTTSEQTICRPINNSRSRPTALSFLVQTQYSNVSESDKYIFTSNPGLQIQTSDHLSLLLDLSCVYVCLWA